MFFVLALFGMIGLARLVPGPGAETGPWSLHAFAHYGVSLIFLMYGIGLSPRAFHEGLRNVRLHLLIHLSTFLLFPLLALAGYRLFAVAEPESIRLLWFGVFYLAILPSTVSSSVVMVSLAGGNVPAAIFNASLSGLLGVFLTPLWMGLFHTIEGSTASAAGPIDLRTAIGSLVLVVVLPIVLGMLLHRCCGAWVGAQRKTLRLFDQSVILLIVYCSFCESFAAKSLDGFSFTQIGLLGLAMTAFFSMVYGIVALGCHMLRFSREDTITATFCGSKKSLMHGMVMAKVLLAGIAAPGLVLLPLMLYHALQLVLVAAIASRLRHRKES